MLRLASNSKAVQDSLICRVPRKCAVLLHVYSVSSVAKASAKPSFLFRAQTPGNVASGNRFREQLAAFLAAAVNGHRLEDGAPVRAQDVLGGETFEDVGFTANFRRCVEAYINNDCLPPKPTHEMHMQKVNDGLMNLGKECPEVRLLTG